MGQIYSDDVGQYHTGANIEETAHGQLLTMRDPYPAKVVVIELHEDFWASSVGPNEKWSAIFLPKKQS